jgi:hypothetical protein
MKKIIESIRSGAESITLPQRNSSLESKTKEDSITDFDWWADDWYPKYMSIGASVFNVISGKVHSVPSLDFKASTVDVSADLEDADVSFDLMDRTPRRVGVSVKISKELIGSMTDGQIMSIIKSGIHAINEEIFGNLIIDALDKSVRTSGNLDVPGLIGLQVEVDSNYGSYFAGTKLLNYCKGVPTNNGYLISGNVNEYATSFDGIRACGTKKVIDQSIIGFGDFRHSAVILYDSISIQRNDLTEAKNGKVVFTFSQIVTTGIITPEKFATTQISIPVITRQPKDIQKNIGDIAVLSVQSYGSASIQWKKGGVDISDSVNHISGSSTNKLVISNIEAGDISAGYTAVLTNSLGSVTTVSVSIT